MPSTINGIGSWYYGRDNVHRHGGTCEFCQNYGTLTSYDTTLFFTFLFVPLVPLRRMHVIDECPSCRKHRALSLREWEELRERTLTDTFAAYRENLRDEKLATEAIVATTTFRHQEAFARVAPVARENLPHNSDVNAVLAGAHEFFGEQEEAAAAFRRSLASKPDAPDVRRALAVTLLRLGNVDEAAPLVADVLKEKDPAHVSLVYLLVEGYQAAGRHQDALRLLDEIARAFPDLADDKNVHRYRKTSEKHRVTGKAVASPSLRFTPGAAVERGRFVALPRLVAPVLLLVGLAIFTVVSFGKASNRPVYVVNGLTRAYDVEVNGERYTLGAGGRSLLLKVKEGDVRVRVPDASLGIPEQVCRVKTSFWSRPFVDNHFVINPDHAAILYLESTEYSVTPDYDRVLPVTIHVGRLLYHFSDVDYVFQDFPSSLTRSAGSGTVEKKRLDQRMAEPLDQSFLVLLTKVGKDAAGQFARRQLESAPERTELLPYLCFALPPEDALSVIRPRLDQRPVLVEWHKHYQDVMGAHNPLHDLYDEYKPLYEEQRDDPARAYLLGRVAPEREEARRLHLQAANALPPSLGALEALAQDAMCTADFRTALGYARKGLALAADDKDCKEHEAEALLALGDYDTLISRAAKAREERPDDFTLAREEAHLRASQGDISRARSIVEGYMASMPSDVGPLTRGQLRASLQAAIAYAAGDASKYASMTAADALTTEDRYTAAVCVGRLDDAVAALKELGVDVSAAAGVEPYLTLYLAASVRGDAQSARQYLNVAVKLMRKGDADARRFADYLAAVLPPVPDDVAAVPLRPSAKRLALAAMARRFPDDRARYGELAKPYNYDRRFPYLLVKQAFARP